jgi:pristinamycin I synthase-3/4
MLRSIELIISVLAVLKAGGAFVPLEPGQPQARLAYMLDNSGASVLLIQKLLQANLPTFAGKMIFLDSLENILAKQPNTNLDFHLVPDNLAYIVYTSGSTGKPKGVLNTHAGAVNYLTYLQKTYALSQDNTVLQLASFSFDASVRDLLGPLTTGAKIVILSDQALHDPLLILKSIRQYHVTAILSIVPTLLRNLLITDESEEEPFHTLRLMLISGETLHWHDWEKAKAVLGEQLRLVNQYGPTECTMTSSYYPLIQPDNDGVDVPIGRPIPNAFFYLLDDHLNPVPAGVTGNVYIGGVGLARGYAQQAGLTAQMFIPHPFSQEPGARLYKTGDLARFRPDGTILFLGRRDNQVKLRGIRIELAEIETVLRQHPQISDTAVTLHEDTEGDHQLIAYIVLRSGETLSTSDLRNTLHSQLPAYMIPSAFFYIETLPRLPNGKLDRQALPAPDGERPTLATAFIAPQTPVEEQLAEIWADVLRLSRVGIHDDFFELGGHSLLATKVLARINQTFHIELPLRTLFEAATIADLALCIIQQEFEMEDDLAALLAEIEELSPYETQKQLSEGGFSK